MQEEAELKSQGSAEWTEQWQKTAEQERRITGAKGRK